MPNLLASPKYDGSGSFQNALRFQHNPEVHQQLLAPVEINRDSVNKSRRLLGQVDEYKLDIKNMVNNARNQLKQRRH